MDVSTDARSFSLSLRYSKQIGRLVFEALILNFLLSVKVPLDSRVEGLLSIKESAGLGPECLYLALTL